MNKNLITIGAVVLVVILFVFIGSNKTNTSNKPNTATALNATSNINPLLESQEFISKYKSTLNSVLIDVRTPAEFNTSHIASAINIDYEDSSFTEEINKLDKTKTYFIYCRSGNRSGRAHKIMKDAGIENIYMN